MIKKIVPEKWIQTKVAVGFAIIVAIAMVIFSITYFSVVSIIKVQNEEYGHEHEFTYLNQLMFEIIETEGLSRVYGITANNEYREQYKHHHDSVIAVIDYLHLLFPDTVSKGGIEEIERLYLQKKELMDQLAAMNIKKLFAESAENILASIPDSLNYEVTQYTYTSLQLDSSQQDMVLEDTVLLVQQTKEEKKGFFRRMGDLFGGGKNKKVPVVEMEAVVSRKVDSTVMKEVRPNENIEKIKSRIQKAEKQEAKINIKVQKHENELIQLDRQLTDQIKTIITNLHNITIDRNEKKRRDLDLLRTDMIDRILLLVAIAVSLMLFFVFWISKDIAKSLKLKNDIIRAKERVDRLLKIKEQFVAHMSHEIRTPLTSIIGFSEQLSGLLKNKKEELAVSDRILLSAEHLNGLINNVLDSSMLESGNIAFYKDRINAKVFMEEIFQLFELKAEQIDLDFGFEVDPALETFESDSLRLKQILINLIGNALKFTHKGSVLFQVKLRKDKLIFTVKDTGIGIPRDKQKMVFKMFNQVNISLSRKYSGTGLGLSISRQIIEAMGGSIQLESKIDEGSTFKFDIPYVPCVIPHEVSESKLDNLYEDKNIMAVDDDEMICQLIDRILHQKVAQLDVISSSDLALKAIEQNKYDLFMVDLHMPKIDGLQMVKIIREERGFATPVLFLTADMVNSELKEANKKDNIWVMPKPFTQKQLFDKLSIIFGHTSEIEEGDELVINEVLEADEKEHAFSLDEIKSFTGNDTEFLNTVIRTFLDNTDQALKDMIKTVANDENPRAIVAERAHKLLTGFRQFKITDGIQILVQLENARDTFQTKERINEDVQQITELWKSVKSELEMYLISIQS